MPDDNSPYDRLELNEHIPSFEQKAQEYITFLETVIETTRNQLEWDVRIVRSTIDDIKTYNDKMDNLEARGYHQGLESNRKASIERSTDLANREYDLGIAVIEFVVVDASLGLGLSVSGLVIEQAKQLKGVVELLSAVNLASGATESRYRVTFRTEDSTE